MAHSSVFDAETRRYLEALPAVARVTDSRIYYTTQFREQAMQRYGKGDSPCRIFTDAGMSPKLIGYKRIERAFARWRASSHIMISQGSEGRRGTSEDDAQSSAGDPQVDLCVKLIGQQSLEIAELKRQIEALREQLAGNGSTASDI